MPSQQFVGTWTKSFFELVLARVLYAVAGFQIDVFGSKISPFAGLKTWADDLSTQAVSAYNAAATAQLSADGAQASANTANSGVASNAAVTQQAGGASIYVSTDSTADVTIDAQSASASITVTSTSAAWGFLRSSEAAQRQGLAWVAKKTGTVSSLNLDVYSLNVATGEVALLYSSPDLSSSLSVADSWGTHVLPVALVVQRDDVLAVQARMTGSGSVVFHGAVSSKPNALARPYQPGLVRNPASSPAPSSISGAVVDASYSTSFLFLQFGSNTSFATVPRTIADNFDGDLGSWVLNNVSSGSNLKISGGQLVFNGTTDGRQAGIYQLQLATDDWNVAAWLGNPNVRQSFMIAASDSSIGNFLALGVSNSGCALYTVTGGIGGTATQVGSSGTARSGGWTITYRQASNTFNVYASTDTSGVPEISWIDTGGVIPHVGGRRYFGLAQTRLLTTSSAAWDNFVAKDMTP
ncbi:hypothetical protein [Gordonia soli]|uniref:Uncharacterized protein n=1 Tax=Gordonia soli NBRC 108243 TaxID=1223545 RepID=M0QQ60_9ACTN|nr:hypothetical protein [Gordonia soli]GAC70718.1 hypothetical protein GS4_39_00490 [Gordonia soli NBRC 108243]